MININNYVKGILEDSLKELNESIHQSSKEVMRLTNLMDIERMKMNDCEDNIKAVRIALESLE